jgi:hypothetical protein
VSGLLSTLEGKGKTVKNLFACILLASFVIKAVDLAVPLGTLASQLNLLGQEVEKGNEDLEKLKKRVANIFKHWNLPVNKSYADWRNENEMMKSMDKIIEGKSSECSNMLHLHFERLHKTTGSISLQNKLQSNLEWLASVRLDFMRESFEPLLILARTLANKQDFVEEIVSFCKGIESAIYNLQQRVNRCFQESNNLSLPEALAAEFALLESEPLSIFEDGKLQKLIETIWSSYYKAVDDKLGMTMLIS